MTERRATITEEELRRIVSETVEQTLTNLGFTVGSDHDRRAVWLDMAYVRNARIGADDVRKWAKRSAWGVFVSTVVYLLSQGLLSWMKENHL